MDSASYTVTYNANGGTGSPATQTKSHGSALTLSSVKPTRSGYTFQGWATSATATTAQYQPGGSYTNNANVTLYAVWKANAAAAPTVAITSDAKTAKVTGSYSGLYARVALVISTGGQSGLYVTQTAINSDGTIVIPQFMVPGLTVTGVNIALVRSIADISSSTPNVVASAFKML